MASLLYPTGKKAILDGDVDLLVDDIRCILVDVADYTYNAADDFLNDVPAAARVAVSAALGTKSTTAGTFDSADFTYNAVTGDVSEALVLYKHTGTETTSQLIAYIDSGTNLPITPNGGNITVQVNASGWFSI